MVMAVVNNHDLLERTKKAAGLGSAGGRCGHPEAHRHNMYL